VMCLAGGCPSVCPRRGAAPTSTALGKSLVSGLGLTPRMVSQKRAAAWRRAADRAHRTLGEDLRRLRLDAGVSLAELARASGVDDTYLGRIEEGAVRPSIDAYAKVAVTLGADLATRLYPNTGPLIRDRHQARIGEALVQILHPRWRPYLEVAVRHPARGWIDVVLHAERERTLVAVEIQSELQRLEQLIRWNALKAESVPSWEGYTHLGVVVTQSRLLLVRSTRATRQVGREFARQLASAYPAHPADAIAALTGNAPWPESALVWIDLRPDRVRLVERR
jgi:transcriptional regulator with XRE-family HTH domain